MPPKKPDLYLSVDFLKQNKSTNIFCEVTPHHLFLTDSDFKKKKGFAKMLPTLKTKKDQKALWDAIDYGIIDTIGTDHAPHLPEEKKDKKLMFFKNFILKTK